MPVLSTTAKVSLAVGAVAVAVGAFMLYKRASATAAEESEDETDSEGEEEEVTAETASPSATKGASADAPAPAPAAAASPAPAAAASTAAAAPAAASGAATGPVAGGKLTKEGLVQVLTAILQNTQLLAQHLLEAQKKPGQQKMDASMLKQIFEMQSAQMHQQILQRAGITHEMFTACMMANKDDPTVRQLMGQTLRMGDLLLPSVPEDVTVETFLPQLEKVMEAFVSGTQAAVENAKKSGLEGEALAKKTMEEAGTTVDKAQTEVLESLGMTKDMFQACLSKFMSDPRIQNVVQTAQQQAMQVVKDSSPELAAGAE